MSWLTDPFSVEFMQRALVGGSLVAVICAIVGVWVVVRGMAFLGEAMAHGMLPGVALATLIGAPVLVGAALSAVAMSAGIGLIRRRGTLSHDTSIGLLFVAMLALGVLVISHSGSFATDATAVLFGDVLAISRSEIVTLAVALAVTLGVAAFFHRAFVALAFDERVARLLGLRPALAQAMLVGLVTIAVVASYRAVGSLLVVGLLLAPAVAAGRWATRIVPTMMLGAVFGVIAVALGLLVSWHTGTAAGASIAATAVATAAISAILASALSALRRSPASATVPDRSPKDARVSS